MAPTPFRIQKYLAGVRYPARKATVLDCAMRRGAEDDVIQALRVLPDDEYPSPVALSCAVAREMGRR